MNLDRRNFLGSVLGFLGTPKIPFLAEEPKIKAGLFDWNENIRFLYHDNEKTYYDSIYAPKLESIQTYYPFKDKKIQFLRLTAQSLELIKPFSANSVSLIDENNKIIFSKQPLTRPIIGHGGDIVNLTWDFSNPLDLSFDNYGKFIFVSKSY